MKWTVTLSTICLALTGCEATGDAGGSRTVSAAGVPFTFEVPSEFTKASVDEANSRGDVLVAAGVSKVDVITLRRVSADAPEGRQPPHEILGHTVTSELHSVAPGYAIECQYTTERRDKVLAACRDAVRTVRRK
jgi:hypothetical protein